MKNKEWFEKFTDIDDEYISEAGKKPKYKIITKFAFTRVLPVAAVFCVVCVLAVYFALPDMTFLFKARYGEYGQLVQQAYKVDREKTGKSVKEAVSDKEGITLFSKKTSSDVAESVSDSNGEVSSNGATYMETTDNQVLDVTEADLIKRSNTHIFQCDGENELKIYKIENKSATLLSTLSADEILSKITSKYSVCGYTHSIFLSNDCNTLTWIMNCDVGESKIMVISVDVSAPESPEVVGNISIDGYRYNTRTVNGKLYIFAVSDFQLDDDLDKMIEELPAYRINGNKTRVSGGDIIYPECPDSNGFTSVYVFDEKTLENEGFISVYSVTDADLLYMSENAIYIVDESDEQTEIIKLDYGNNKFTKGGSVKVDGRVNNQYSLDEYDNMLRVVTTVTDENDMFNASLYIVDCDSMKVKTKLEKFAPVGESVKSVRFKEKCAYVCTAVQENYIIKDPVYYIDLSDINNITSKNTGTIDGQSFHLVELSDGYLLGIGMDSSYNLKLEMYKETEEKIECVTSKIFDVSYGSYSHNCKAYLVDRQNNVFGFCYYTFDVSESNNSYNTQKQIQHCILLKFDGTTFKTIAQKDDCFENYNYGVDYSRFLEIDNMFYTFPCGIFTGTTEIKE